MDVDRAEFGGEAREVFILFQVAGGDAGEDVRGGGAGDEPGLAAQVTARVGMDAAVFGDAARGDLSAMVKAGELDFAATPRRPRGEVGAQVAIEAEVVFKEEEVRGAGVERALEEAEDAGADAAGDEGIVAGVEVDDGRRVAPVGLGP